MSTPPLYTKTGDTGQSSVINSPRLPKDDPLFEAIGTLDELNAHLGSAATVTDSKLRSELLTIQDKLLTIGGLLAGSREVSLLPSDISFLESRIDFYQANTNKDWYHRFLLPGGTEPAARLDIARTVCRRAERRLTTLFKSKSDKTSPPLMQAYLNRLSDYLFAARCFVNSQANYTETQFRENK